jgi:hypothetical protein
VPPFIPEFLKSTLSLLGFVGLGAAGLIDGVEVTDRGIMAESSRIPSFALGNIAYHGYKGNDARDHEFGHLVHEDELGIMYLPMAGLSSLIGNIQGLRGKWGPEEYYGMWTERKANEYGGR